MCRAYGHLRRAVTAATPAWAFPRSASTGIAKLVLHARSCLGALDCHAVQRAPYVPFLSLAGEYEIIH